MEEKQRQLTQLPWMFFVFLDECSLGSEREKQEVLLIRIHAE